MNLCTVCGEDFSGVTMFDRHRVGPHDGERRCLDLDEMQAKGWRLNVRGQWFDPANRMTPEAVSRVRRRSLTA